VTKQTAITTVALEPETLTQFDAIARSQDRTRSWLLRDVLKKFIADNNGKIAPQDFAKIKKNTR
jgi:predicted transcriptional regulator